MKKLSLITLTSLLGASTAFAGGVDTCTACVANYEGFSIYGEIDAVGAELNSLNDAYFLNNGFLQGFETHYPSYAKSTWQGGLGIAWDGQMHGPLTVGVFADYFWMGNGKQTSVQAGYVRFPDDFVASGSLDYETKMKSNWSVGVRAGLVQGDVRATLGVGYAQVTAGAGCTTSVGLGPLPYLCGSFDGAVGPQSGGYVGTYGYKNINFNGIKVVATIDKIWSDNLILSLVGSMTKTGSKNLGSGCRSVDQVYTCGDSSNFEDGYVVQAPRGNVDLLAGGVRLSYLFHGGLWGGW